MENETRLDEGKTSGKLIFQELLHRFDHNIITFDMSLSVMCTRNRSIHYNFS